MPQLNVRGVFFQVSWSLLIPGIVLKKSVPIAGDVFWLTHLKLKQKEEKVVILLEDLEERPVYLKEKWKQEESLCSVACIVVTHFLLKTLWHETLLSWALCLPANFLWARSWSIFYTQVIAMALLSTMYALGVPKIGIIVLARSLIRFQLLVYWRDGEIENSF